MFVVFLIGTGAALMTFRSVRQIGASLLASADVAGLVAGIAARPVIGNLIAGLQIAHTQPIQLDDVVIIEGQWGRIEEITAPASSSIWDERRLVVPLQWVIEHPFENWTRRQAALLGTVTLWLDYRVDLAPLREELKRLCEEAPEWDGRVALIQVVETTERAIQVRTLVTSDDASRSCDLRCRVRQALIYFLHRQQPDGLPSCPLGNRGCEAGSAQARPKQAARESRHRRFVRHPASRASRRARARHRPRPR
jgi:small-conductance mechanosensitive channel